MCKQLLYIKFNTFLFRWSLLWMWINLSFFLCINFDPASLDLTFGKGIRKKIIFLVERPIRERVKAGHYEKRFFFKLEIKSENNVATKRKGVRP